MTIHGHCEICGAKNVKLIKAKDEAGDEQAVCEPCFDSCAEGWKRSE